jgi:hypothetical protein
MFMWRSQTRWEFWQLSDMYNVNERIKNAMFTGINILNVWKPQISPNVLWITNLKESKMLEDEENAVKIPSELEWAIVNYYKISFKGWVAFHLSTEQVQVWNLVIQCWFFDGQGWTRKQMMCLMFFYVQCPPSILCFSLLSSSLSTSLSPPPSSSYWMGVLCFNLGWDTGYPDSFHGFPQSPQQMLR